MENILESYLKEHLSLFNQLLQIKTSIDSAAESLKNAVNTRNKIMICGNGGSAADSQHFATELIGRFEQERRSFPAVSLTTDTSALTALGNDYGYDKVFVRQLEGL